MKESATATLQPSSAAQTLLNMTKNLPPSQMSVIQSIMVRFGFLRNNNSTNSSPAKASQPTSPVKSESTTIVLKHPKNTHKKKKKNTDHSFETHVRMHRSSSAIVPPLRNIHTPDWAEVSTPTLTDNLPLDTVFEIVEAHKRIEIFEYRIQCGEDKKNQHPALAIKASEETEQDFHKTEAEIAMGQRYEEEVIYQPIPLFWEQRCWDDPDNIMSTEQSDALHNEIEDTINSVFLSPPSPPKTPRPKTPVKKMHLVGRPRKHQKPSATSVVTLNCYNYETEDSDADTDFDDF